jgi:hypothetical protein
MPDKLYFDNLFIGEIDFKDADFPSLWGSFKLTLESKDKLSDHILNYIEHSKLYILTMLDSDNSQNVEYDELEKEGYKYIDLIETNNWKIISESGEVNKILCPVFNHDNTINWRWNFST